MNAWFTEEEGSASFDRTIVFARICPSKIMDPYFDPIEISKQKIPSWKGVHTMLSFKTEDTTEKKTVIGNKGRPTDWNTIYTGLKRIEKQMQLMNQQAPLTTIGLQLYAIAQEIR